MSKLKKGKDIIFYCDGKKCCRYNEAVQDCFKSLISEHGLEEVYALEKMKCQGMCKKAPVVYLSSKDIYKKNVGKRKAEEIFEKYIA